MRCIGVKNIDVNGVLKNGFPNLHIQEQTFVLQLPKKREQ